MRKYGEREYPQDVHPEQVDNGHNSHGDKSPYTAGERKQAAALIRTLEQNGMDHNTAIDVAFDTIGLPTKMIEKVRASNPALADQLEQIDQGVQQDAESFTRNQQRSQNANNSTRRTA